MKLEGSEIYENISIEKDANEIQKRNALMQQIISFLPQIKKISYISEDDNYDTNMADLQVAVSVARLEELQTLINKKIIPFDGGLLKVTLKK